MADVILKKHNNIYVRVDADRGILMGMTEYFSRYVKGYQFMPTFKSKVWDGKIRFLNFQTGLIYAGLVKDVLEYCKDDNLSVIVEDDVKAMFKNDSDIDDYLADLELSAHGNKIELRDYQVAAIQKCINQKRRLIQSPTSSGKSSIIYGITRYLLDNQFEDEKILIVVPTIGLVNQMRNDFKDYSSINGWDVIEHVGCIGGGQREDHKQVIISTWQSIFKLPASWFDQFRCLMVDEVHQATAKSLTGIGQKCNAEFRIGLSGSIDSDDETSEMTLKGLFGFKYITTTTKQLMQEGTVATLDVQCIHLKHEHPHSEYFKKKDYQKEIAWLVANSARNNFITDLSNSVTGNVLVLFSLVQKHGKVLKVLMEEYDNGKEVFFVYGGTEVDQRENIRHIAEAHKGCIILASYQTFSTGVNIRNIHNIIFAAPTKSFSRVIQSIGRGLRRSETKSVCTVYDIYDEIYGNPKKPNSYNYTLKHFIERVKIYIKEGFNYKIEKVDMEWEDE